MPPPEHSLTLQEALSLRLSYHDVNHSQCATIHVLPLDMTDHKMIHPYLKRKKPRPSS